MAQSNWDREEGRGEGALCTLRELSSQWTEKVGLEKQVLKQLVDAFMKEAIVVTLCSRQHRMGEVGRGEGGSLLKTVFISSSISYCSQSLCLIRVHL